MDCASYIAIHSPESTSSISTGVCLLIPRQARQREQVMQRLCQLQHLRSAQNSGILLYLSLFYAGEIEISISLPPDKRNLNRGICHTLIFDPPEMTYLQDFHQVKTSTQSSHFSIWYLIEDAQRQESSGKGSINTRISL